MRLGLTNYLLLIQPGETSKLMRNSSGGENVTMAVQDQQQLQGSRKGKQRLELYICLKEFQTLFIYLFFQFTNILQGVDLETKTNEQVWVEDVEPSQLAAANAETDPLKLVQSLLE